MFTGADAASGTNASTIYIAASDWADITAVGMDAAAIGTAAPDEDATSKEAAASVATRIDDAFFMELPWMHQRLFLMLRDDFLALPP